MYHRIRRDLASGQLTPSGDLWPRFLYKGYIYDPKDPWDGLFRSALLLKVCLSDLLSAYMPMLTISLRLSGMSSLLPVLLGAICPGLPDQAMPEFMG